MDKSNDITGALDTASDIRATGKEVSSEAAMRAAAFSGQSMVTTATMLERLLEESATKLRKKYPSDAFERNGRQLCWANILLAVVFAWTLFDKVANPDNTFHPLIHEAAGLALGLVFCACWLPAWLYERYPHIPRWAHPAAEVDDEMKELLFHTSRAEWLMDSWTCEQLKRIPMNGKRLYWSLVFTKTATEKLKLRQKPV